MRQKAEREIRKATASLKGDLGWYRIDQVRERTALIRKVFDKTILDMERVGTIELTSTTDSNDVGNAQIGNLITRGETIYISFAFLDAEQADSAPTEEPEISSPETDPPIRNEASDLKFEKVEPEKVNITLQGFYREEWEQFEYLCRIREGKPAIHKVWEMICEYNRRS